jgi:hypothetical protein
MEFTFDPEYNARLYDARRVTFEDALEAISTGDILFHFSYPTEDPGTDRRVFIVRIAGVSHFVPYIVSGEAWLLETVYPLKDSSVINHRAINETKHPLDYLNGEERQIIETLDRADFGSASRPGTTELSRFRRTAKKFLKRQKRGKLNISRFDPQQDREHAGKLGSQSGVARRW